jgi:hypothetical protein
MRIRTIKPEFFNHEAIFELEKSTKLPLRLAYIGLWCAADREGRFKWEPRRLGVQIMPYDGVDFSRVLDALATRAFVVQYRVNDVCFGLIPSFIHHQVVNNRESASVLPEPPEDLLKSLANRRVNDASGTRDSRDDHAGSGEGKGREGKGKEGVATKQIPPSREDMDAYAQEIELPSDEVDAFVDHFTSNGWRVGRGGQPMKDWKASMRTWKRFAKRGFGPTPNQTMELDLGRKAAAAAAAQAEAEANGWKPVHRPGIDD